jgi:hypothetical protein
MKGGILNTSTGQIYNLIFGKIHARYQQSKKLIVVGNQ